MILKGISVWWESSALVTFWFQCTVYKSIYLLTYLLSTTTTKNNNRFMALCPGLPGWAGTRRNTHPPTILIIIQSLSASSIYTIHSILLIQTACLAIFLHNLSLCLFWSTSWSGALHLIFRTFIHPISVFFSQHMPITSQPVLLQ